MAAQAGVRKPSRISELGADLNLKIPFLKMSAGILAAGFPH
jgi:hypothetical protein